MFRFAFAFVVAPLALGSAQAADIAGIDCVAKTMTVETLRLLEADIVDNFTHLDTQTYSPATAAGLKAANGICRAKYGWSDKAAEAANLYALFLLGMPTVRQEARKAGVDVAKLEARFAKLTRAEKVNSMDDMVMRKLGEGALKANEMNSANAKPAGVVFGFLGVSERAKADFIAN